MQFSPANYSQYFTVPAGNGFPSIRLRALDPIGFVQDEIAKRDPAQAPAATDATTATATNVSMTTDLTAPFKKWLGDTVGANIKGLIVAAAILLLAVLLIVLGAWQFTNAD